MSKIIVTTVFFDERYKDSDRAVNEIYDSENEKTAEDVIQALEGYIVYSGIVRDKRERLIKSLAKGNHVKYYKIIKKMCKQAIRQLQ